MSGAARAVSGGTHREEAGRTAFAATIRPLVMSQRGDSGRKQSPKSMIADGTPPSPSITRQPPSMPLSAPSISADITLRRCGLRRERSGGPEVVRACVGSIRGGGVVQLWQRQPA